MPTFIFLNIRVPWENIFVVVRIQFVAPSVFNQYYLAFDLNNNQIKQRENIKSRHLRKL